MQLGQQHCRDIESMKAWSQRLGDEDLATTFSANGELDHRQGELIARMEKVATE